MTIRNRIFEIIEVGKEEDRASQLYDAFMMVIICISIIPLCTHEETAVLNIIDKVTVMIFIIDYLLRLLTADLKMKRGITSFVLYPISLMAIIDLVSILPSLTVLAKGYRLLKIFRLFRTFKVFKALKAMKAFKALKILRYSKSIEIICNVIKTQKEALLTVGGLAVGYIFVAALIIFNVEPDSFNTFFDAIYWACVSLTTVGYGDIYPVSEAGRIVTMISAIVGIAIVALPSGIIAAGYMDEINKQNEK